MSILKQLSDQLSGWDEQLEQRKAEAAQLIGDKKQEAEAAMADLKVKAAEIRAQVEQLREKDSDELTAEAKAKLDELGRRASGEIGKGLDSLAAFFKSKA
ncbi:MAG: hypothetical protein NXI24_23845 [bacterium]|nr:hypothetical protein [bacterium]